MKKTEILTGVREVLVSVLEHEDFELTDELTADQVDGWDSLSHMIIITGIEEKFQIKFKLKELSRLKNLQSLIELIQSKVQ